MRAATLFACLGLGFFGGCGEDPSPSNASNADSPDGGSLDAGGDGDGDNSGDGDGDRPMNGSDGGPGKDAGGGGGGEDAGKLTDNGYPVADHCSPGSYYYFQFLTSCLGADLTHALAAGVQAGGGSNIQVQNRRLVQAMVAGEPYAISLELEVFDPETQREIEIWGVESKCASGGEVATKLGSLAMDRRKSVYCFDLNPTQAYTDVLFVVREHADGNGFGWHGQTYCLMASCPAP